MIAPALQEGDTKICDEWKVVGSEESGPASVHCYPLQYQRWIEIYVVQV
jgi:hypothetical protein